MKKTPLYARKLQQLDNFTFSIEWENGSLDVFRLADLQKNCPCANCVDEITGLRVIPAASLDPHVKAKRISNVGRYALRIEFTSGCSTGIYDFDLLRRIGEMQK